jgi:hypothetical protein
VVHKKFPEAQGLCNLPIEHDDTAFCIWEERCELQSLAGDAFDCSEEFSEQLFEGIL